MKKIVIFAIAFFAISISANAQSPNKEASKSSAVAFSERDGVCLVKTYYPLGKVADVEYEILQLEDVAKKTTMCCLRLKTKSYSSATRDVDEYVGTLDADEVSAFIQSLVYIKDNLLPTSPTNYTECIYNSKDGVKFGAYYDQKANKWMAFVYTKSYTTRSAQFFSSDDIEKTIAMMNNATAKIAELTKK